MGDSKVVIPGWTDVRVWLKILKELKTHAATKINMSFVFVDVEEISGVRVACRACVSHRSQMGSILSI